MPTVQRKVRLAGGQTKIVKLTSKDPDELKPESPIEESLSSDDGEKFMPPTPDQLASE